MWTEWIKRHPLAATLVAAVIVHSSVLLAVRAWQGSINAFAFDSLDCREYYELAQSLLADGKFERQGGPEAWRTPGYPGFLAAAMLLVGTSPAALIVVQHLLGVASTVLLARVACAAAGPRRALLTAAIFLLEPYHLFYSLWLLSETLFTTCLLVLWLLWTRAQRRRTSLDFLWLGLLAGGAILVRPLACFLPAALAIATVLLGRCTPRPALMHAAVLAGAAFLLPAGWMTRNLHTAGHFALSSQSGVVLAYFKAAEVRLWQEDRTADRYVETSLDPRLVGAPHLVWGHIDAQLHDELGTATGEVRSQPCWLDLAQGNRTPADSFVVSGALRRAGLRLLLESPLATLACCTERAGELLTMPLNLAMRRYTGVPPGDWRHAVLGGAYTLLVLGVVIRLVRGTCWAQAAFPLAGLAALLVATTPQLDPRLRVPMIPLLALLAVLPRTGEGPNSSSRSPAGHERLGSSAVSTPTQSQTQSL